MPSETSGSITFNGQRTIPIFRDPKERQRQVRRTLILVLACNLLVALAKLSYGLLTQSLSMTADGLNSLMDAAANIVGLVGVEVAARPPDSSHPYGHRRFETLASLLIAATMVLAVTQILESAWHRIQSGERPDVTPLSFVVMVITLVINLGVSFLERRRAVALHSSILSADAKHTAADALVSTGVIVGLVGVRLGYPWADLVVSIGVAGVIAWGAWTALRDAAQVLADRAVVSAETVEQAARAVPGVVGVHGVRTRGGEGMIWVDLHIQVAPQLRVDEAHEIASQVAQQVEAALGLPADVVVHVEPATAEHLQPQRGYEPWRGRST
ncbi:cation diffusion facilitator family transporter [Thermorudis peleae]|uniref:cation diffusion facilitator family transporter n=1 Tax=Thermorudis peleae TaxID=1382356 RepID=UPI00069093FF|nr:cation diffusion facilitator family transporter [Thermorudis peleae]